MRSLLTVLSLLGVLATSQRVATGELGTIKGKVRLTTKVRGNPLATAAYAPRAVGRYSPPAKPEIFNVVVYLKGLRSPGVAAPQDREIVQRHESFVPRVVAVPVGSTVGFPNADDVYHNVFSLSQAAVFDLGRFPKGQSRTRRFERPGLVKVYCHLHSQMSATILVLDHAFFTTPDLEGQFALDRIPPGHYTVVGWHERVGERTVGVDVRAGDTATVELSLPVEEP